MTPTFPTGPFAPNASYTKRDGSTVRCQIVLIEPPFAYGRTALVKFADSDTVTARVGCSRLKLDSGRQL